MLTSEYNALLDELQQTKERLERSQAIAHLGSWELDLVENRLCWSDEVYRIFGLRPQQFRASYEAFLEAVHPDDRAAVDAAYAGSIRDGKDTYEIMHRVVRAGTGEVRWVHEKCQHMRNANGDIVKSVGMVQDITERKQAEDALRESEKELRSAALFPQQNPSPILRVGRDGRLLFANPNSGALLAAWKCSVGESVPDDIRASVESALSSGAPHEVAVYAADRDFSFLVTPIRDAAYANLYGRDVTDRNRAERAMREAQKFETVGALAAGVAHDFNNLLTSIMGNASLLQSNPAAANSPELCAIIDASEKAASLTHQLLAYAGKAKFYTGNVDLAELVRSSAELIRVSIPRSIDLVLDIPKRLPVVHGDRSQIQQVLMNLIINAAEAIGDRPVGTVTGIVRITAGVRVLDDHTHSAFDLAPGAYTFVRVEDDGCGMDADTKAKIFDPFFTTKFTGRGLGLAAVQGIVRSHKGGITVDTIPDAGTTFTVYLPSSIGVAPRSTRTELPIASHRPLTILVVDDEPALRSMLKLILERSGHKVQLAANGQEALDCIAANGAPDLVILDVIMPVMGGRKAYDEIKRRWPQTAVLMTSASTRDAADWDGIPENVPVIRKPYTAQEISLAVVNAIRGRVATP